MTLSHIALTLLSSIAFLNSSTTLRINSWSILVIPSSVFSLPSFPVGKLCPLFLRSNEFHYTTKWKSKINQINQINTEGQNMSEISKSTDKKNKPSILGSSSLCNITMDFSRSSELTHKFWRGVKLNPNPLFLCIFLNRLIGLKTGFKF